VAALTTYGGYSEYVCLREKELIPTSEAVDPGDAVTLVLNYLVAYQTLHRSAKVQRGDKVLIVGAGGGIGTAFLQLGQLAQLTMYGTASKRKHSILARYGATPIDYHTQDLVDVLRKAERGGVEAVFDGIGGAYLRRGFSVPARGGTYVGYANPLSIPRTLLLLAQVLLFNLLPNGRSAKYYGTGGWRINRQPFPDDWAALFSLLQEGRIKPVITERFPLEEAAEANALLETGTVVGNLVLLSPAQL
jgi:NADPH:quinone reductase-like Zn-dependent oxidoreductase